MNLDKARGEIERLEKENVKLKEQLLSHVVLKKVRVTIETVILCSVMDSEAAINKTAEDSIVGDITNMGLNACDEISITNIDSVADIPEEYVNVEPWPTITCESNRSTCNKLLATKPKGS